MEVACVDVPWLPLQLAWRHEPAWRALPVVIVDDDRPTGVVRWACERARAHAVLPGQRFAHALARCPGLRARVLLPSELTAAQDELSRALHAVTPRVELDGASPGTAWLDGAGLARMYPDAAGAAAGTRWAEAIAGAVTTRGLSAVVVVGASRFATYAIARAARPPRVIVCADADAERVAARAVPLARLDLAPRLRDALARLGVTTVGELVRLPGGGILERFGAEAHRLYQLAAGERWDPLRPTRPPEALDERVDLDDDERDVERLLFLIRAALDRLLDRLAARGRALTALYVELTLRRTVGHTEPRVERLAPAAPTLDGRALLRLVHLRLEAGLAELDPAVGVHALRLWADDVGATHEQLALFAARPRRDLRAAAEAVARLRAELGDDAVVRAVLRDGHLPEARFSWQPIATVHAPAPPPGPAALGLVRRVLARAQLLPNQPTSVRDDGWCLTGLEPGAVVRLDGPYLVSGGWWASPQGVAREYHLAETRRGDCLWIYYDRIRRRWLLQGAIE